MSLVSSPSRLQKKNDGSCSEGKEVAKEIGELSLKKPVFIGLIWTRVSPILV